MIEIEIKNTIKNEMPPIAGFTLVLQRTCSSGVRSLAPKLKENFKNNQLIKNEKKVLIKRNSARNETRYCGSTCMIRMIS